FQQSYSGFRELIQEDNTILLYDKFHDWSMSGNPFYPVTEKFMTYYLKKDNHSQKFPIKSTEYKFDKGFSIKDMKSESLSLVSPYMRADNNYAFMSNKGFNNFVFQKDQKLIPYIKKIQGKSNYRGRVGLGLYPKELLLFTKIKNHGKGKIIVENYQGKNTERKIAKRKIIFEDKFFFPVIEGPNIKKFKIEGVKYIAPLPYSSLDIKKPISHDELKKSSPLLSKYYTANKKLFKKTDYNSRVQGGQ
ncbi:unnamed protein product, partial [marine sediment metagenome]